MPGKPPDKISKQPLLTECETLLLGLLCERADVFEFGSGGSTLWLASRAKRLVSIEHDADWHNVIANALLEQGHPGVDLRLVPLERLEEAIKEAAGLGESEWDVVFVDCHSHHREKAIKLSTRYVKPGGWLIADDYDFEGVERAVERLRKVGWKVDIVTGIKMHPLKKVLVRTAAAFCHKPCS